MQEQEHVTGGHRGARIHLRCASPRRIEDAYVRTCGENGAAGIAAAAVDRDDFGVAKGVDGALETGERHRQCALLVENDRNWVTITEDPQEIIDALYRRKGGARSLQRISLALLEQAARADEKIADAFYTVERLA